MRAELARHVCGSSHQMRSKTMELTAKKSRGTGRMRRLLSTRQGTALVAGACTLVAAAILLIAAASYRNSVDATARPETVFVASSLIQKGTPGDVIANHGLFHTQRILTKQV